MDKPVTINPKYIQETSKLMEMLTHHFAQVLDRPKLDLLFKHGEARAFQPGDTLIRQGEKIDGIFIILEGTVLVTGQMMGQGITNLETLHPGYFFSAISFMEKTSAPRSFIAADTVRCFFIPNSYFDVLLINYAETRYQLLYMISEQIAKRLQRTHDSICSFISDSNMLSLSFFERIIYSLQQPTQIRFGEEGIESKEVLQNKRLSKLLSKAEIEYLIQQFTVLDAQKNCKLVTEGEKSASCYLVLHGAIQSCIIRNNKLAKLSVIGPGTLLASIGCIDPNSTFNITYITCEHTILCKLPEAGLQLIKNTQPLLWYKLFELISTSLAGLKRSIDKLEIRLHTETYNR